MRKWRSSLRLCLAAVALGALASTIPVAANAASSGPSSTNPAPVVKVSGGALKGKTSGGANDFLGIPYAAPPVGQLRWKAPQPAAAWSGVRSAVALAPHCAQPGTPFGVATDNEDCLYLNVYTPAGTTAPNKNRPVLVWIHGGGLRIGESDDYDPTALAAAGTVVVTINYRLGALGFLAHPSLVSKSQSSTGAYGLLDQQAALRWVQRNIGHFGGNAKNVTIAGQSAGALSVLAQVVSPAAKGLFQRAIVETGAFALTQTPLASAETSGESFATAVGCADQSAACLRNVPVSKILLDQDNDPTGYVPGVIDGTVLKQSIGTALASGHFNRVPILTGTTHDESRLFVGLDEAFGTATTAANYVARISETTGASAQAAQTIAAQYPLSAYPSAPLALSAVDTDAIFTCPALNMDKTVSKFVPTYAYEFNDENAPQRFLSVPAGFPYGAAHIAETQYLFNLPTAPVAGALNAQQQKLATAMKQYWASFAASGMPSASGQATWPAFNGSSQKMLSLIPSGSHVETNFAAEHKCGFWSATS
jgi:para-nitrobenzyl esterase